MSVFDDDNDDVKESIRFFNRLPDADKGFCPILTRLFSNRNRNTSRYFLFCQNSNRTYPSTTQLRSGKN